MMANKSEKAVVMRPGLAERYLHATPVFLWTCLGLFCRRNSEAKFATILTNAATVLISVGTKERVIREEVRRKKIKAREQSEKVAERCVFQCFVPPEGRKAKRLSCACRGIWGDDR